MKTLQSKQMRKKDDRGFTLLELLVAMFIGIFVVGATITIMSVSNRLYRTQERVADIQQDVRAAIEIMALDIRMAVFDPMHGSGAGILRAEKNILVFQKDTNMSKGIEKEFEPGENIAEETIAYSFDEKDHEISRALNGQIGEDGELGEEGGQPLVSNVSQLEFAYFDENGAELDPAKDIKAAIVRVRINVTCQEHDPKGNVFSRTLATDVSIRNRVILPRKSII